VPIACSSVMLNTKHLDKTRFRKMRPEKG